METVTRSVSFLLAALSFGSCAESTMNMDMLSASEEAAFQHASATTLAIQQLGVLADNVFDFGVTIDPRANDVGNAQNIEFTTRTRLMGCGTVTLSGAAVTIDFTSGGCTGRSGARITGSVVATVTRVGPDTNVAMQFPSVSVDGYAISGMATFATNTGTRFTVTGSVAAGGINVTIADRALVIDGTGTSFAIDGPVSATDGSNNSTATFAAVHYALGSCYVDGGTLTAVRGATTETLTFAAATATTGQVNVAIGERVFPLTLLPHGSCPPSR